MKSASALGNQHLWFADELDRARQHVHDGVRTVLDAAFAHARDSAERPLEHHAPSGAADAQQEMYAMIAASAHGAVAMEMPEALAATADPDDPHDDGRTLRWYQWPLEALLRHFHKHSLPSFEKFADFDARWLEAIKLRLTTPKISFPMARRWPIYRLPNDATIAIAGDWGTGLPESDLIAMSMRRLEPDVTIHLGDVYYAGFPPECQRFANRWPAGKRLATLDDRIASFTLNSNHEMYGGGWGYFGTTLKHPTFAVQDGVSYFALETDDHVIVALDTAYFADALLYSEGRLDDDAHEHREQVTFLDHVVGELDGRNLFVLTHHNALSLANEPNGLFAQVRERVHGPFTWIWGHEHNAIAYHEQEHRVRARCVGHGGIPSLPFSKTELAKRGYAFAETELADDVREPQRALDGFYRLSLEPEGAYTEAFYDERCNERFARRWLSPAR